MRISHLCSFSIFSALIRTKSFHFSRQQGKRSERFFSRCVTCLPADRRRQVATLPIFPESLPDSHQSRETSRLSLVSTGSRRNQITSRTFSRFPTRTTSCRFTSRFFA